MRLFGLNITQEPDIDDRRLSILDHLEELRSRLLKCIGTVALLFPVCWYFCSDIIRWFLEVVCADLPKVQTLQVMELFFTQMKVSFFLALILAYPVVAFQVWRFVAPGLYRHERYYVARFVVASTALFVCGAEMALFYVFPRVVQFGVSLAAGKIDMVPQLSSVISLAGWLMLGFGVMFQLPILVYLLAITGLVSVQMMRKTRPVVVIAIFTLSGILTPTPDVVTQCVLAIPSWLLFEASLIFTDATIRRKRRREEQEARGDGGAERGQGHSGSTAGPAAVHEPGRQPGPLPPPVAPTAEPAAPAPADVTAPAEPQPVAPAAESAPSAPPPADTATGETANAQAPGQSAAQTSWERWYANVEEPPAAPAAPAQTDAPKAPAAPPPAKAIGDDDATFGSGAV